MRKKDHVTKKGVVKRAGILFVPFLFPYVVFAQAAWCDGTDCTFKRFVSYATGTILKPIIPILVTLTVAYFLWGTYEYIALAGAEDKRVEGRKKMLVSVIALAVMMSFWGLAQVLEGTFF